MKPHLLLLPTNILSMDVVRSIQYRITLGLVSWTIFIISAEGIPLVSMNDNRPSGSSTSQSTRRTLMQSVTPSSPPDLCTPTPASSSPGFDHIISCGTGMDVVQDRTQGVAPDPSPPLYTSPTPEPAHHTIDASVMVTISSMVAPLSTIAGNMIPTLAICPASPGDSASNVLPIILSAFFGLTTVLLTLLSYFLWLSKRPKAPVTDKVTMGTTGKFSFQV